MVRFLKIIFLFFQDLKIYTLYFLTVGGSETLTLINGKPIDVFQKSLGEALTLVSHCDNKDKLTIPSITYVSN